MGTITSTRPISRGSLIGDVWRELYPSLIISTVRRYLSNHEKFFDEIFEGNFQGKSHPVPFIVACFSFYLLIGSFALKKEAETWTNVYDNMDEEEMLMFMEAFQTTDAYSMEEQLRLNTHIQDEIITTAQMVDYLRSEGQEILALKLESKAYHLKSEENTPIEGLVPYLFLVLFLFPFWRLSHNFLGKKTNRTPRETMEVYTYNMGIFLLLSVVAFLIMLTEVEWLMAPFAILYIYLAVKALKIFRYTHQAGFFRLMYANFMASLMIMLIIGIPFLLLALLGLLV